ncbi:MAG: hypothetical protein IPG93_17860 [Burkholderiales bacterium]|nr:hypothetical protein [Burkholderiales bacterium]
MKTRQLFACVALTLAGSAFAAGDAHNHTHEHKPLHGGIVVEASDIDFELVARADVITLYVRDHGKPAATLGATGKLTLLSGADKAEAVLAPAGDNKLEAKGSFKVAPGTKLVATVTLAGKKAVNVRFAIK